MSAREKNIRCYSDRGNTGKTDFVQNIAEVVSVDGYEEFLTFYICNITQGMTGFKPGNPYKFLLPFFGY